MVINKRKLRQLEGMVLPHRPEPAMFYLSDGKEITLSQRSEQIKLNYRPQAKAIMDNETLTFEEKTRESMKLLNTMSESEKLILQKDNEFMLLRMVDILYKYFEE